MRITRAIPALTAVLALALALAACGGDDDPKALSDNEYAGAMNPIVQRITGEFGAVFAEVGEAGEGERVPAGARERLRAAARVERDAVVDLTKLTPPEGAEAAHRKLAAGGRAQAAELDRLAGRDDLTVGQMADAMERGPTTDALKELAAGGWVEPPPHQ